MAREKRLFVCADCGADSPQWQGRCVACGAWNSLKEMASAGVPAFAGQRFGPLPASIPVPLSQIPGLDEPRRKLGVNELDRVLGGGLVAGSVILIGGDPGIGKSTLLLQALAKLADGGSVLYASGEESSHQIKLRAERLGISSDNLLIQTETRLEAILQAVEEHNPQVLAIDSIQTMASGEIESAPGTVTQVRTTAARLIGAAKGRGMPLFLVGHVTKDGQLAGPRVLEHMVDTVLYFEGERGHHYRILRAVKNRFGPANEIGVFEMTETGMREVENPSELFLSERVKGAAGSVVFPGLEGTRPLLMEIQALVVASPLAQPRRTTLGLDGARLGMLTAILERRAGIGFFDRDIFLNVAGGLSVREPAADLAILCALFASHRNFAIDPGLVVLGEVGLSGEVRAVAQAETRLKEAAKLGFSRCLLSPKCIKSLRGKPPLKLLSASTVEEAVARLAAT